MALFDWLRSHETLAAWLFGLSLDRFVASLVVIPLLIARMRPDYFVGPDAGHSRFRERHWLIAGAVLVLKNLLGIVLLLAGIAMLVLPGQGLITMFMGLSLLSFPGKRQLELRIMRQQHVRAAVGWIRGKAGRPPLQMPEGPSR